MNSHPNGRHQPLQVALLPKSHSPEELLSSRHRLALVFRQHRAAGVEKSPPQLLIIRGGHRQHPTPTPPAFVLSSYKLSGKLFEDGGRSRAALINSPSALVKLLKTRGGILMSSAERDVLRAGFREEKTISLWLKTNKTDVFEYFTLFLNPLQLQMWSCHWDLMARRDRAREASPSSPFATAPELFGDPGRGAEGDEWGVILESEALSWEPTSTLLVAVFFFKFLQTR